MVCWMPHIILRHRSFYRFIRRTRSSHSLYARNSDLIVETASYIQHRTGSYSISVNRMAAHLNPTPFIHANCSVQMISPRIYPVAILRSNKKWLKEYSRLEFIIAAYRWKDTQRNMQSSNRFLWCWVGFRIYEMPWSAAGFLSKFAT
jgi:hypothetical protein